MDKKLLGQRIKELRKSKNYKQEQLAEKLGIEPRQLSKLETGKNYPSFETAINLLKVFDITFEELIDCEHLKNADDVRNKIPEVLLEMDNKQIKTAYKILKALAK